MIERTLRIGDKLLGPEYQTFIIAEASSNHGGDLDRAKHMIDVAADAGADAVKFQLFKAEKLVSDAADLVIKPDDAGVTVKTEIHLRQLFKENELPLSWLPELVSYAQAKGVLFMATPFDADMVDALESVNVAAYKIASNEIYDVLLIRKILATKKPVFVSTGMSTIGDIERMFEMLDESYKTQVSLLHCNSVYPSPPEDIHLHALKTLERAFPHNVIGYSDHSLGIAVPIAAVALGARVIEKHFILGDGVESIDDSFSLTPEELTQMVAGIRIAETALGSTQKKRSITGKARSLWAVCDVKKGERFTPENVHILRPGRGLSPLYYDLVMGTQASRNVTKGPLTWEDLVTR